MKENLRIALTYNLKKGIVTEHLDEEAEYDDMSTVLQIADALRTKGYIVDLIEATRNCVNAFQKKTYHMVFNFAEGLKGRGREAQIPALLSMLDIPYTGSDETTLAIALDKALTKRILSSEHIDTPKFQLFTKVDEALKDGLNYPLIVKPNAEGSSKGIDDASIAYSRDELLYLLTKIIIGYRCDALVEEYISGREFTVGIIGNDERIEVLPIMEIMFLDDHTDFYSYRMKKESEEKTAIQCPANLSTLLEHRIKSTAKEIYSLLNCRDVARMDFRLSHDGKLHFIEINPLPGLVDGFSDLTHISKAAGMTYNELINRILDEALIRTFKKEGVTSTGSH